MGDYIATVSRPIWRRDTVYMDAMPSENELTAALMRLCDDPDAPAHLHLQADANHGHVVTLDCAYDAEGLIATFMERSPDEAALQRLLTSMQAQTPSAAAARRIAHAYQDFLGMVGNAPTITADMVEQRIAKIARIALSGPGPRMVCPVRVSASVDDTRAFELHAAFAGTPPRTSLLRFHGTDANGFACATMWHLENGYASYTMLDYAAGPLDGILVDALCTLRLYAVRGWL